MKNGGFLMQVIGTDVVETYLAAHAGHRGFKVARSQYGAWLRIAMAADWRNPEHVKVAYPKASIPNRDTIDAETVEARPASGTRWPEKDPWGSPR